MVKEYAIHQALIRFLNLTPQCMAVTYYNGAIFDPRRKVYRKNGLDRPNGFPDIVGSFRGLAFAIEVKRDGKNKSYLSPNQRLVRDKMEHKGWPVATCRNIKDAEAFLEKLEILWREKNGISSSTDIGPIGCAVEQASHCDSETTDTDQDIESRSRGGQ